MNIAYNIQPQICGIPKLQLWHLMRAYRMGRCFVERSYQCYSYALHCTVPHCTVLYRQKKICYTMVFNKISIGKQRQHVLTTAQDSNIHTTTPATSRFLLQKNSFYLTYFDDKKKCPPAWNTHTTKRARDCPM